MDYAAQLGVQQNLALAPTSLYTTDSKLTREVQLEVERAGCSIPQVIKKENKAAILYIHSWEQGHFNPVELNSE